MDQTHRPLVIPPDFANYAESYHIFDLFKRLMSSLVIHKPDDPIKFIIEFLQQENDDVHQIMILGPPASGKRSIATMLSKQFDLVHISMEDVIESAENRSLKSEALECRKNNKALSIELWSNLVNNRLKCFDAAKKGWVMESVVQTREQALVLASLGHYPKHCVLLDAPDTVLIERAAGKRIDPVTKDIYHLTFEMPSDVKVAERLVSVEDYSETKIIEDLIIHHRYINGMKDCYNSVSKIFNADQPKIDVFSQVMTFVCQPARSAAPHIPRIIIIGPFGSGKTHQANLLAKKYQVDHVSSGNLINQAIADDSPLGQTCQSFLKKGIPIPEDVVMDLVKNRLTQLDCSTRGWVLHGFPKTREQAEQLDASEHYANRVYFFDIPNDSVMERITQRATDPVTGERYHMLYNPPRSQEIKDRLRFDPKDSCDVVRKRLAEYRAEEAELKAYYTQGVHINAEQDSHRVFESIETVLVNPLPKCHVPEL